MMRGKQERKKNAIIYVSLLVMRTFMNFFGKGNIAQAQEDINSNRGIKTIS